MARNSKEERDLIIGLGVLKDNKVQGSYSHLKEDFQGWLVDVARATPPHHTWFSKCWDQVIFVVLVQGNLKFIFAAHECVGRGHARQTLLTLRDELRPSLAAAPEPSSSQVGKIEKKLKPIACSMKGVVPPRRVLILYEGAPKKFLTKEEQAPEFLAPGGKTRLQKELEDFDKDEDDFVFSLKGKSGEGGKASGEGGDEDDDDFTFTIPPKNQQQQAQHKQVPQSAIFQTPHMRNNHAAAPPRPNAPAKKIPSPGISTDFTWNGSRVSPDDKDGTGKQQPSVSPLASTLHTGFLSFRGKQLFSAQFEKNGGGKQQQPPEAKGRGQVGQIAPSGLRWEDEIAAQLAAAGVRVSSCAEGDGEEDEKSPSSSSASKARFPGPKPQVVTDWRTGSLNRQQERGTGLSRISKGFRRAFNRQGEDLGT